MVLSYNSLSLSYSCSSHTTLSLLSMNLSYNSLSPPHAPLIQLPLLPITLFFNSLSYSSLLSYNSLSLSLCPIHCPHTPLSPYPLPSSFNSLPYSRSSHTTLSLLPIALYFNSLSLLSTLLVFNSFSPYLSLPYSPLPSTPTHVVVVGVCCCASQNDAVRVNLLGFSRGKLREIAARIRNTIKP